MGQNTRSCVRDLLPGTTFCGASEARQTFQKVTAGISEASHLEEEVRAGLRCCRSVSGLLFVLGVSLSCLSPTSAIGGAGI
jgi:hypothetical protein